ncbi:MAG: DEAD/DEAH box helicase family protein, partial [Oscillospiraceae bacterium]|nr:DEAD/DEAH box helicase family protein [Oscillospiraceae bacterium]
MLHNEEIKVTVQSSVESKYGDYIPRYYETHNTEGWVKDALESEVDYWRSCQPVLLDAPTGCGKTTFVYDVLVKGAMEKGKNLLLISNRLALSLQQKKAIQKITGIPSKGHLTDEGLQAQEDFGAVRVITYHRLPALVKDPENAKWLGNVAFVVADEVHFFTADALFNPRTGYYLSLICKHFQHAVRLYMTATPDDIFIPLEEQETYACRVHRMIYPLIKRNCVHYHFQRMPAPCQLHFFNELNDLLPRIEEASSERWLIFVDSKIKGKAFADTLGTKALYLDADSKGSEEYRTLLLQESFQQQVLITTSVFDNGINISDPTLK